MQLSDSGVGRCELPYTVLTRGRAPRKGWTSKLTPTGGRHPPVSEPGLRSAVWPASRSSAPAGQRLGDQGEEGVDLVLVVAAPAEAGFAERDRPDFVRGHGLTLPLLSAGMEGVLRGRETRADQCFGRVRAPVH